MLLCDVSVAAVSQQGVTFDFILSYTYCCPHVAVCLNLVYNKAEEEFSLLEMSATFLCWSDDL